MNTLGQWLHQHEIALAAMAVIALVSLILLLRWRSLWRWLLWSAVTGASIAAIVALRTPAASISEHHDSEMATAIIDGHEVHLAVNSYSEPSLKSVADIENLLGDSSMPTLVEIYADYGFD